MLYMSHILNFNRKHCDMVIYKTLEKRRILKTSKKIIHFPTFKEAIFFNR